MSEALSLDERNLIFLTFISANLFGLCGSLNYIVIKVLILAPNGLSMIRRAIFISGNGRICDAILRVAGKVMIGVAMTWLFRYIVHRCAAEGRF
jgi:hypothetical protein